MILLLAPRYFSGTVISISLTHSSGQGPDSVKVKNTSRKKIQFFESDMLSSHKVGSVHFGQEKGQEKREMGQSSNNPGLVFKEAGKI